MAQNTLQNPVDEETSPRPRQVSPDLLPPWNLLLHNDDVNDMLHVVTSLRRVLPVDLSHSRQCMLEAHLKGYSLLLTTHRELAELYQEQLTSCSLTVTIEPAEA